MGYLIFFIILFLINNLHCSQEKKVTFATLLIVIFTGIRYNIGFDYLNYWGDIEFEHYAMEPLSGLLQMIGHETSPAVFFFLTSLLMYPIMIKAFTRNSIDPMESVLFFVCFQSFYICSLSTIRQAFACAFVWWMIFLERKSVFKIITLSIIAACFHSSGLAGLLLLFPWKKLSETKMLILFAISVFGSYMIAYVVSMISSDALIFLRFARYLEDESVGATKMKYLIWFIYVVVILNYKRLVKIDTTYHYYIAIATLGVCLYNATIFSPHVSDRLMAMFWSTVICMMPALRKVMRVPKPIFTIICVMLFAYSINLAATSSKLSGDKQNTYYPYRTIIETENLGKGAQDNYL